MNFKRTNIILGTLIFTVFLYSCKENVLYENSFLLPGNIWQINDTLKFKTKITDNKNYYNIFIHIDVKEDYLTDNIWLLIDSESPSGNMLNDTVMFFIFDQTGKQFGQKHGDNIKNKFLYKAHILFPETGTYMFFLRHGMRKSDLPRISSAGISIEKAN